MIAELLETWQYTIICIVVQIMCDVFNVISSRFFKIMNTVPFFVFRMCLLQEQLRVENTYCLILAKSGGHKEKSLNKNRLKSFLAATR